MAGPPGDSTPPAPDSSTLNSGHTTPNIAILSGEMSGDVVGGALAGALAMHLPHVRLWGIGSAHMAGAGVELLYNSADWSAIGVIEALRVWPELRWRAYPHVVRQILSRSPDVVVLIDFGAFNSKVARFCKSHGVPVVWYFPPGSWRKGGRANAELARITDRIATPFPWSEERLKSLGAKAEFVGHPLLEIARPQWSRAAFAEQFGLEPGEPIVGLLPGSRGFEVTHNAPAMLGAAQLIRRELPGAQFVFAAASPAARQRIQKVLEDRRTALADFSDWMAHSDLSSVGHRGLLDRLRSLEERLAGGGGKRLITPEGIVVPADVLRDPAQDGRKLAGTVKERYELPPVVIVEDCRYDVMAHADVLLVCSGTATLEAALLGTPMVIMYRGSRVMELEAKVRRVRPEHVGMPNIVAGRRVMPEFLQDEANPEALAGAALRFLRDPECRAQAKADLADVRSALAAPRPEGATARTAEIVLEVAGLRNGELGK